MVINLETGCGVREGTIKISSINNNVVEVIFPVLQEPTSLSRVALTCSGFSDMRKSLVVSTQGASPSFSGAYWTFLIISFTVLLLYEVWC